ncbi:hypothetical protein [Rossellomorea vietnamensis]|uniref:hypothetical protein n=1 Tax=Rossellomorea vietnamensis TaxID=218284 RepID=UPI003D281BAF
MSYMDFLLDKLKENSPSVMDELNKEREKYAHISNPVSYEEANSIVKEFYSNDTDKTTVVVRPEVLEEFTKKKPSVMLNRTQEYKKTRVKKSLQKHSLQAFPLPTLHIVRFHTSRTDHFPYQ